VRRKHRGSANQHAWNQCHLKQGGAGNDDPDGRSRGNQGVAKPRLIIDIGFGPRHSHIFIHGRHAWNG
jgi:hypothetical protein